MYIEKLSKEEQDLVRETDYYLLLQAVENATDQTDRLWTRQLVLARLELMAMQVSWDELSELAEISGDELYVVEAVASVKMKIEGGRAEAIFPAEASHSSEPTPDLPFCEEGSCDRTKREGEVVINDYSEKWSLIERNQIKEIKNHINDHFWSDGHYNDHVGLDVSGGPGS